MKKLLFPLFALFILLGFKAYHDRLITGLITSNQDGLPLTAVNITSLPSHRTTLSNADGTFKLNVPLTDTTLQIAIIGFKTQTIKLKGSHFKVALKPLANSLSEVVVVNYGSAKKEQVGAIANFSPVEMKIRASAPRTLSLNQSLNSESYADIQENGFKTVNKNPLSTFAIDVDAASYSNVRRYLNNGTLPPKDAVRIEEMINYFDYDYQQPKGDDPVHITTEISAAPWNSSHRLLHIGMQAKTILTENLPASNLVFLIDVSGSMNQANKLPLLITSLKMLTDNLRKKDKVAIVVYAGNSGLVLPATSGDQKTAIKDALEKLSAGGSTAGGAGIELAYRVASANFIPSGNNRIILATDGDFNMGQSSDQDMQKLIEEKRKSGIFLTVLGYGMGNYKDSKMEILANKGNGNYAYIDNITEARKVLITEFGGTLFTVAKDVKLQLEFNPSKVQAYRLIGYENRLLNDEDFNNDKKDAGEIGSGHSVTALYEIIPTGIKSEFVSTIDPLKYQEPEKTASPYYSNEILTIKLRYKKPQGNTSKLLVKEVIAPGYNVDTSPNYKFSAAVASFGMLLRQSEYKQKSSFNSVIALAQAGTGSDKEGYRAEFLKLVKSTQLMAKDLLDSNTGGKQNGDRR